MQLMGRFQTRWMAVQAAKQLNGPFHPEDLGSPPTTYVVEELEDDPEFSYVVRGYQDGEPRG
jgi:hypothetical protein